MLTITVRTTHDRLVIRSYTDPIAAARRVDTMASSGRIRLIEQVTGDPADCVTFAREAFAAILQNTPRDADGRFPETIEHAIAEVARRWAARIPEPTPTLDDFPIGTKVHAPDRCDEVFVVSGHDRGRNKVEVSYPDAGMLGLYDPAALVKATGE